MNIRQLIVCVSKTTTKENVHFKKVYCKGKKSRKGENEKGVI